MRKKLAVSGLGSSAGRLPVALALLWLLLMVSPAAGGESIPAAVDPVTEGLSRVWEIVPANPNDFTFAVFGDNRGSTTVFENLLTRISNDPDILFAVSLGDIVGIGTPERFDSFFSQVSRYLTKPLILAAGNHELSGGGTALYESLVGRLNYAFTFGDCYFIIIDDTNESRMDPVFEKWLAKELTEGDRYSATLVFMHVPLYDPPGSGIRHSLGNKGADRLMDVLGGRRITHAFCGHIHGYFTGDWKGIPYTISGGAGAPLAGTDPAHFFYHYLKVRVKDGTVTYEPVPAAPAGRR